MQPKVLEIILRQKGPSLFIESYCYENRGCYRSRNIFPFFSITQRTDTSCNLLKIIVWNATLFFKQSGCLCQTKRESRTKGIYSENCYLQILFKYISKAVNFSDFQQLCIFSQCFQPISKIIWIKCTTGTGRSFRPLAIKNPNFFSYPI